MNITISNTYVLKWEHSEYDNYKWTKCGKCFNTKTNREIKKILNGRSIGFCINGKFKSLSSLRKNLIPIQKTECPF